MTPQDEQLLRDAAKAAGIERGADRLDCGVSLTDAGGHRSLPRWNPLEDDGDAMRLASACGMVIDFGGANGVEVRYYVNDEQFSRRNVLAKTDYRRAIVRAAAAITTEKAR